MAGDAGDDEVILRGMYGPDVTFLGVPRVELDALAGPGRTSRSAWTR